MKKKTNKPQSWQAYAASAVAFLATAPEAKAYIVYNDIDPDSSVGIGDTLDLDIDGDGTNDIRFWIENMNGTITSVSGGVFEYSYRFAYASGLDNTIILGTEGTNSGYSFQSAYNFLSGDTIGYEVPGFFNKARLAAVVSLDGVPYYSGGPWNGIEGIMGFRFNIGEDVHYGWIRLEVVSGGTEIILTEYAWDNQTGVGIEAGLLAPIEAENFSEAPAIWVSNDMIHIVQGEAPVLKTVELFSLTGQKLWDRRLEGTDLHEEFSWIPGGIYIIIVRSEKQLWSEKIQFH